MKLKVRLFGTLSQRITHYNAQEGIDVEIPDGARVKDLLAHLGLSESNAGIVFVEGQIRRAEEELQDNATVNIFQAMFGG
jgi:molybdopterin synthase sulfur carrier subunit